MLKKIENALVTLVRDNAILKQEMDNNDADHHDKIKVILLEILEVLDDFDAKFLNIAPKLENTDNLTKIWINNFKATRKMLSKIIHTRGVVQINSLGARAVPGYHHILEVVERKGMEDEIIVEELKKGYLWNNEVLRKAEVITVNNNQ